MSNVFSVFTVEEINLMCIYSTDTRENLLSDLRKSQAHINDSNMLDIVKSTIEKLERISDTEFADVGFHIADDFESEM